MLTELFHIGTTLAHPPARKLTLDIQLKKLNSVPSVRSCRTANERVEKSRLWWLVVCGVVCGVVEEKSLPAWGIYTAGYRPAYPRCSARFGDSGCPSNLLIIAWLRLHTSTTYHVVRPGGGQTPTAMGQDSRHPAWPTPAGSEMEHSELSLCGTRGLYTCCEGGGRVHACTRTGACRVTNG
ncbi:hypothetical protein BDV95DRAFT_584624 [Massariosphaeria phaeospora]|uniref:Uncharacterized protein n=1 Tax=Massariosphaeria phaeospora TaxID=100035 RepID=A0A7C8MG98_9PLEO|nr:hypothetical protein BDV95DRAFT_584624 [Massariosphaeria phaeospora]